MKTLRNLLAALLLLAPGVASAQPHKAPADWPPQVDLPAGLRMKNTGGTDGAGLCVWTSLTHSARWQGEAKLFSLRADMEKKKGGGWPQRVDQELSARGVNYLQYEGRDLEGLKAALACGLMPSVTWNAKGDPNYRGPIAHMVNLVHLDDRHAAILDNNHPGQLLRMTPAEFLAGYAGKGSGWAVFLLDRGPPAPVPVNALGGDDFDPWGGVLYEWRYDPKYPGQLNLFEKGGKQVGAYSLRSAYFRYLDWDAWELRKETRWLSPCDPPFPIPLSADRPWREGAVQTVQDFGVISLAWMPFRAKADEKWSHSGKKIDRATALKLLTRHKGKRHLSVVLPKAEQAKVLADLAAAPELAPWRDSLVVQGYEPTDALAAGVGLRPGLVIQAAPDNNGRGKVLHRQDAYTGAADLVKALRKTDPNYDPARDPDLRKAAPPKLAGGPDASAPVDPLLPVGALAVGAVLLFLSRRKEE